jgi:hypothetical protein
MLLITKQTLFRAHQTDKTSLFLQILRIQPEIFSGTKKFWHKKTPRNGGALGNVPGLI